MQNELLEEIKETCRRAIRKSDEQILDEKVHELDKKHFISIGGSFDSVILMAEELEKEITKLQHFKDTTVGLWATDKPDEHVDTEGHCTLVEIKEP